jgi:hypothetical protein
MEHFSYDSESDTIKEPYEDLELPLTAMTSIETNTLLSTVRHIGGYVLWRGIPKHTDYLFKAFRCKYKNDFKGVEITTNYTHKGHDETLFTIYLRTE